MVIILGFFIMSGGQKNMYCMKKDVAHTKNDEFHKHLIFIE